MADDGPLEPGGPTGYPLQAGDPGNWRLPEVHSSEAPPVRWRDLPPFEQLRRTVEGEIRYVAQRHGRLLNAEAICNRKHWRPERVPDVVAAMNDPVTMANLRAIGVLPDDVDTWEEAGADARCNATPTGRQMSALDSIFARLDPTDKRPLRELLAEHDVDLKMWNGWLADPVFAGYVADRMARVLGERAHEVDIALFRRGVAGDVPAIKLILELQGRIKQAGDTVDVNALLARVVEIIDVEVSDRDTKVRIAQRLQALSDAQLRRIPTGPTIIAGELTG